MILIVGTRLGTYEIVAPVGSGGMARAAQRTALQISDC
jgi:hypothetical protein